MTIPARGAPKVLYVEGNVDGTIGGSYYSLLFLASGLDRTRYDPHVTFHQDHALMPRYAAADLHPRVIPKPAPLHLPGTSAAAPALVRAPMRLAQRAINMVRFLASIAGYARRLRRERVAVLHLNNSPTRGHDWMLAARLAGVPCVVHERGINAEFSALERWLAPRLAAIICISDAARNSLVGAGLARDNVHVIHNGVDPDKVQPTADPAAVRRELGLGPADRAIALVGNIRAWKGQDVLVRALPAVLARVPDVKVLLVGDTAEPDRPFEAELRALIARLGVERQVIFTGYRANPADVLQLAEIAVHTSVTPEPFGRVLVEGMALRLPIVGSNDGAVPEIVDDGVTGLLFPPGDGDRLAERLIELLEDPARARAMGEAGYARLQERFHVRRNVERTMAIYDRALAST
jgi:glycosyltransferase involved in cell wall biosynthesis